jgi:hypothetical protein
MFGYLQYLVTQFAAPTCSGASSFFGFPTWYKYLNPHYVTTVGGDKVCMIDFNFPTSLPLVALAVVDILLRIAALVALGYVVAGGFKYTTSQGEPQELANARSTIIGALVGLAIATVSSVTISFIGNKIGG